MFFGFLLVSTLLCTLVTGFVFTYAIVVMPGFGKLNDWNYFNNIRTSIACTVSIALMISLGLS